MICVVFLLQAPWACRLVSGTPPVSVSPPVSVGISLSRFPRRRTTNNPTVNTTNCWETTKHLLTNTAHRLMTSSRLTPHISPRLTLHISLLTSHSSSLHTSSSHSSPFLTPPLIPLTILLSSLLRWVSCLRSETSHELRSARRLQQPLYGELLHLIILHVIKSQWGRVQSGILQLIRSPWQQAKRPHHHFIQQHLVFVFLFETNLKSVSCLGLGESRHKVVTDKQMEERRSVCVEMNNNKSWYSNKPRLKKKKLSIMVI